MSRTPAIRTLGWAVLLSVLAAPGVFVPGVSAQAVAGVVAGRVVGAAEGEAVSFAQVLVEEAARSITADADGHFELIKVPAGDYTLKVFRVGYRPYQGRVRVAAGDTTRVTVRMAVSSLSGQVVVVHGQEVREHEGARDVVIDDRALRQEMGATIASTLDGEPGLAMQSMGPAPARPVLRGLGGERLLVLEDGAATGDLSQASSDHAVAIEPMTADQMEVIRGPGALQYGPNVLGGVVNVVRGFVPDVRPDALHADLSLMGESVSRTVASSGSVEAPLGPLVARADGSYRDAGDVHTPTGVLGNTALTTYNASTGLGWVGVRGHVGGAFGQYHSAYGIPGGFVGAHPDGVSIVMDRSLAEVSARYRPRQTAVSHVDVEGRFTRYQHQEYEREDVLGVEFGVLSYRARASLHTDRRGWLGRGAVGVSAAYRDYASGGLSFTPPTTEQSLAAYAFQEWGAPPFVWAVGLRADHRVVEPARRGTSSRIGDIRTRRYAGLSGGASAAWTPGQGVTLGARLLRSLRLPGIEELYSEGPHLAAYTFEVGNPDLRLERGWGGEFYADYAAEAGQGRLALFYNRVSDFIFPQNTGEVSRVQLPIYQFAGTEARFVGGEATVGWAVGRGVQSEVRASYVRATNLRADRPLPQVPPLTGAWRMEYRTGAFGVGTTLRAAAAQERTGAFEASTEGYAVLDASLRYALGAGPFLHTFDLVLTNLLDTEYRNHLSRVRSIMPEPGRNVRLLYRIHF